MKEYKFVVSLCGGYAGGEISVKAEDEDSAYDKAMALVGEKLNSAFPTLIIDYAVELAEGYDDESDDEDN